MLKRIMMGAIAGLLLVASSARADEKMSDVEAYVAIIPVMYKVADDNPAQARTRCASSERFGQEGMFVKRRFMVLA